MREESVWVEPGRILVEEGRPSTAAFIVLEGWATVSYAGRALTSLGPGTAINSEAGSMAPRVVTVTAATRMHLRVLDTVGTGRG